MAKLRPFVALIMLSCSVRAQEWTPWRVLGPFDHPAGSANIDSTAPVERQLQRMRPGEAGPDFDEVYRGRNQKRIRWAFLPGAQGDSRAPDVGCIDFLQAIEPLEGVPLWSENAVVYLYRSIDLAEPDEIALNLGSDDGLRLWWNAELVIDRNVARPLQVRDHSLVLRARPGRNHLLAKISNGTGAWAFQMLPWSKVPQSAIDNAIDRGVAWLLSQQLLDGSFGHWEEYGGGHTAFVAYTLLKCGLPATHPALRRALACVRVRPLDQTYALACALLAVASAGDPRDAAWIQAGVERLLDWQEESGLYAYPVHPNGELLPADLSNTLFVALALRAAQASGAKIPARAWINLVRGTLTCLEGASAEKTSTQAGATPKGFSYRPAGEPTGSITTAGISVLAMAQTALGSELPAVQLLRAQQAQRGALAWLERNMTWVKNAGPGTHAHHYYFVYGLERVGSLLALEQLGGVNWYWDGAEYLVKNQRPDGSWLTENEAADTLLALLFLKRATAPSTGRRKEPQQSWRTAEEGAEIVLQARGAAPLELWVAEFRPAQASALEWPATSGGGLRVERVDFYGMPASGADDYRLLASAKNDPTQGLGARVLGAELALDRRGLWFFYAEAHLLRPPASPGLVPETHILTSPSLRVAVGDLNTPGELAYAAEAQANLLRGVGLRIQASSSTGQAEAAAWIADARYATRWHCAVNDPAPWIELLLERPVRIDRIALAHGWPRPAYAAAARPAQVELLLNGEQSYDLAIDPDPLRKSTLQLERPLRVRSLRLSILSASGGTLGNSALGFSEIEFLLSLQ